MGICEQASGVDFSEDVFIVSQMQALVSMGHPEKALEVYEDFRKALWEEFEMEPGEQVYLLAKSMCQNHMGDRDILKLVAEGGDGSDSAFLERKDI